MNEEQIKLWGHDVIEYLYHKDYIEGKTEHEGKTHLARPDSFHPLCGVSGIYLNNSVSASDFHLWEWDQCQRCAAVLRSLFNIPKDYTGGIEASGYQGSGMLAMAWCPFCNIPTSISTISPICAYCDTEFYKTNDGRVWFDPQRKSEISWVWKVAKSISHLQIGGEKHFPPK